MSDTPNNSDACALAPVVPLDPAGVPAALRSRDQWVLWRYEPREGKVTKVPFSPVTGHPVDVGKSSSWMSFDAAVKAAPTIEGCAGMGFVFTEDDGLCGVDLDKCLDERGCPTPGALKLIRRLDTYCEISPSGTGVKLYLFGTKPTKKCRRRDVFGCKQIEVYDSARFFCVTGRRLEGTPATVESRQEQLDGLCREIWPESPQAVKAPTAGFDGDDDDLIEKACSASNGDAFKRLFRDGDTSKYGGDDSAADLALCLHLAFWTAKDAARMDRLFRASALFRAKWNREDYRDRTIAAAIEKCDKVYTPPRTTSRGADGDAVARPIERDGREAVYIDTDEHRVVDEAVAALEKDPDLYTRGTALVRVIRTGKTRGRVKRAAGSVVIAAVPTAHLRERLTRLIAFEKFDKKQKDIVPAHPPGWLVGAVDARGSWPGLRPLKGISEAPFLREDGSICQTSGYDEASGVLYMPTEEFPPVAENPTRDDALRALGLLKEVVIDFKFEAPEHRSGWLAGLLTPLARHAYDGPSPLFLVDANIRGAGKGLLCHSIGTIVLGREMPVSSYTNDTEELRKKITTIALAGDAVILWDNLEGKFGNDALDRALTSTQWKDRILGRNEQADLPLTTVWFATGNNVQVAADTARRIIHVRLDVLDEHPEDRDDFQHPNLLKWLRERRGDLLVAALTILSAFCKAGRPAQDLKPMGSFEGWSDLVRSALVWLGEPDPLAARDRLVMFADTTADGLGQLLSAWQLMDAEGEGLVLGEIVPWLYPADKTKTPTDHGASEMRAALENIVGCPPGKVPNVRSLGNKLKSFRRRPIDGQYLDIDPNAPRRRGAVWKVVGPRPDIPV